MTQSARAHDVLQSNYQLHAKPLSDTRHDKLTLFSLYNDLSPEL